MFIIVPDGVLLRVNLKRHDLSEFIQSVPQSCMRYYVTRSTGEHQLIRGRCKVYGIARYDRPRLRLFRALNVDAYAGLPKTFDVENDAPVFVYLTARTLGVLQPEFDALTVAEKRKVLQSAPPILRDTAIVWRGSVSRFLAVSKTRTASDINRVIGKSGSVL